jgi:preprotein translocase subunit SecY
MAANISLANFAKATELKKRLWFTLGALILFRCCPTCRCPASTRARWHAVRDARGGVLDFFNTFSGGSLERMSIIALGVMPYITASIVVQLGATMYEPWRRCEGRRDRAQEAQPIYPLRTVLLTTVQGYFIAVGLERLGRHAGHRAVVEPGMMFRVAAPSAWSAAPCS